MTQKARQSQSSSKAAVHPVVLFGVNQHGKPIAARFLESQAQARRQGRRAIEPAGDGQSPPSTTTRSLRRR
jgi:hypothetical protein